MFRVLWVLPLCMVLHGQDSLREATHLDLPDDRPAEPNLVQKDDSLETIVKDRPLQFLQMCLDKYDREVKGYTCTFRKQERVHKKLRDPEKIRIAFREKPFSVSFDWQQGADRAQRALYVQGQNNGLMYVRPTGFLLGRLVVSKDPDGAEARQTSRYTIKEFGLRLAMQRTLDSMKSAQGRGGLHLTYAGLVQVPELNDRPCHKYVRAPYDPPEEEGVNELVLYIDRDTWLQVGSILRDRDENLIAEYFFRDLQLNPEYPDDQFSPKKI